MHGMIHKNYSMSSNSMPSRTPSTDCWCDTEGELTFTMKFWGDTVTVQLVKPENREPNMLDCSEWCGCRCPHGEDLLRGVWQDAAFSLSTSWGKDFFPWTRIPDTASFCATEGRSYSSSAFDRWPVTSRMIFSGTPAVNSAVAPVARKLWLVFFQGLLLPCTLFPNTFEVSLCPLDNIHTTIQSV